MKIHKITIYGYGKLENKTFSLHPTLQVFYGENEAGKSTIMSFIHSVLFGFPTKQQAELRYEPKMQHKYGGKLEVFFQKHGLVTIERVKGKATGEVTVLLENGTRGGEALLTKLLQEMDKSIFQSIFSFNLHGLQNIQQMKGEELGRFLFSTGAIGSDVLLKVENDLQKELDALYKPNGRKPLLNQKITELREKHKQLKQAEKSNNEYELLLQQKKEINHSRIVAEKRLDELENDRWLLEEWIKMKPVVREKEQLEERIQQLSNLEFPVDGLNRWKETKEKLIVAEEKKKQFEANLIALKQAKEAITLNEPLLENERDILVSIEKLPLIEQMHSRIITLTQQKERLEDEIHSMQEKLHLPYDENEIEVCNTSIFMKEACLEADRKQRRLREQRVELDERLKEEQAYLEKLEEEVTDLKARRLPSTKREQLEEKIEASRQTEWLKEKAELVEREMQSIEQQYQQEKKKQKNSLISFILMVSGLLAIFAWLFSKQESLFAIGMLLVIVLISIRFFLKQVQRKKENQNRLVLYDKRKRERKEIISQTVGGEDALIGVRQMLQEDDRWNEKYQMERLKLKQQNDSYERVLKGFEKWEENYNEHQKKLRELGNELKLPYEIACHYLYDAFLLLEEWKEKERLKEQITRELQAIEEEKGIIEARITNYYHQLVDKADEAVSTMCFHLKKALQDEKEKKNQLAEFGRKRSELEEEVSFIQVEKKRYEEEKEYLFTTAKVKEEEAYLEKEKQVKELESLKSRLSALEWQLEVYAIEASEYPSYKQIKNPATEIAEKDEKIKKQKELLQKMTDQLAALSFDISQLESGGTYTEILHTYKQLQAELAEDVREWGKYAVAKQLLVDTVKRFKDGQLPIMLQKAEANFSFLTEREYQRIIPKEEGAGFLVERKDHMLFEAKELSQGTTEQLYLSIRLALAQTFYKSYSFPFIIDDSFVNFDKVRTKRVIELLKSCKNNQLLFFTCHMHLLEYFTKDSIECLSSEEAKTSL